MVEGLPLPFLGADHNVSTKVIKAARESDSMTCDVHSLKSEKHQIKKQYDQLIKRFTAWAEHVSDIRAAIVVGSRARTDVPADEWADLDIIVVTQNPDYYVLTCEWIQNIGTPLLTFLEPSVRGDEVERRVLFEGMLDVDFPIIPEERVRQLLKEIPPDVAAQLADTFGRGVRVLVDKDGVIAQLVSRIPSDKPVSFPPEKQEFHEVISDFLYHAVWTAKHLRRGELWWAKGGCDSHMKWCLLRMAEWHARAVYGEPHDTWFRGRFLEKWAYPRVVKGLKNAFAYYNEKDVKRALLVTMDLFRWVATETGKNLGYPYLDEADKKVTEWVNTCLSTILIEE